MVEIQEQKQSKSSRVIGISFELELSQKYSLESLIFGLISSQNDGADEIDGGLDLRRYPTDI